MQKGEIEREKFYGNIFLFIVKLIKKAKKRNRN